MMYNGVALVHNKFARKAPKTRNSVQANPLLGKGQRFYYENCTAVHELKISLTVV